MQELTAGPGSVVEASRHQTDNLCCRIGRHVRCSRIPACSSRAGCRWPPRFSTGFQAPGVAMLVPTRLRVPASTVVVPLSRWPRRASIAAPILVKPPVPRTAPAKVLSVALFTAVFGDAVDG